MYKYFDVKTTLFALTVAIMPGVLSAQIDSDIPVTVDAGCFSICLGTANVKGVQGDATVKNFSAQSVQLAATVKVQCNGADVPGATQSFGPTTVGGGVTATYPYSIQFAPVAGCNYTVVARGTSSFLPGRSTTVSFAFLFDCIDQPCGSGGGCTLTQGFWKNHPEDWPVTTLTLGTVSYSQTDLLKILNQPVKGNGLVSLAHQLIAAKLNIANSASGTVISATIAAADAKIGALVVPPIGTGSLSTSSVGGLVTGLDQFNNGLAAGGPGHCAQ
jgi:hypothetical protein